MRGRDVGMAGGLVAALGVGGRFLDDCGRAGVRVGSSVGDDAIRVGAAPAGSLLDDPVRSGARLGDDGLPRAAVRGAMAEGSPGRPFLPGVAPDGEIGLGRQLLEEGLVDTVEFTVEAFEDDDVPAPALHRYRDQAVDRILGEAPVLLQPTDRADLALGLAMETGHPIAVLRPTIDDGHTLLPDDDGSIATSDVLALCVVHDVECIVLACPETATDCSSRTRSAWTRTLAANPSTRDTLVWALYAELGAMDVPPFVVRLHTKPGGDVAMLVARPIR